MECEGLIPSLLRESGVVEERASKGELGFVKSEVEAAAASAAGGGEGEM